VRSFYVEAECEKKPHFGEVLEFIRFRWKGEELWVAVIQGWSSKNWLEGYEEGQGPQQLLSKSARVDVVEIKAMEAIAARLIMVHSEERVEVAFEISQGSMAAEMF
jgi:hypothetical protein